MVLIKLRLCRNDSRFLTTTVVVLLNQNILFVEFDKVSAVTTDRHMAVLHVAMQTLSRLLTRSDGIDGKLRTGKHITAHKDIQLGSLIGQFVGYRIYAAEELYLGILEQILQYNGLPNGKDHQIGVEHDCLVLIECGRELMILVEHRQALLESDSFHLSTFTFHFHWSPSRIDNHTVFARLNALLKRCGHYIFRFQREHRHLGCPASFGYACCIDSHVATAYDYYSFIFEQSSLLSFD